MHQWTFLSSNKKWFSFFWFFVKFPPAKGTIFPAALIQFAWLNSVFLLHCVKRLFSLNDSVFHITFSHHLKRLKLIFFSFFNEKRIHHIFTIACRCAKSFVLHFSDQATIFCWFLVFRFVFHRLKRNKKFANIKTKQLFIFFVVLFFLSRSCKFFNSRASHTIFYYPYLFSNHNLFCSNPMRNNNNTVSLRFALPVQWRKSRNKNIK